MKKLILILGLAAGLSACNSGSGADPSGSTVTSQLTTYPESGVYVGTLKSNVSGLSTQINGQINVESANFNLFTPSEGNSNIVGSFQLNNNICFVGSQSFESYTFGIYFSDCNYGDYGSTPATNSLTGNYSTNYGDYGTISLVLLNN